MSELARAEWRIVNRLGLHARAAAKFVRLANNFTSSIELSHGDVSVNGKSIMGVMMLVAGCGSTIRCQAEGPDAHAAIAALAQLVATGFGEGVVLSDE